MIFIAIDKWSNLLLQSMHCMYLQIMAIEMINVVKILLCRYTQYITLYHLLCFRLNDNTYMYRLYTNIIVKSFLLYVNFVIYYIEILLIYILQ